MEYRDKVVIVTGASSGIGHLTARAFAQRGATVVAAARRAGELAALIDACRHWSPASEYIAGDLGDRVVAEGIVEQTVRRHGRLDVLVNNAAMAKHKHILRTTAEEAEAVLRVNFHACVWTTLVAMPAMLRQGGGTIVNVSSFAAFVTPPREALYAASKAALNAFSAGLWHDLAGTNIHVALINPGPIDTDIWRNTDEPHRLVVRRHPPRLVVEAIFEAIERRRYEVTVPRRSPLLLTARVLRLLMPGVLRRGIARRDPVPAEAIAAARTEAHRRGGGTTSK
jgi:short-subunit dehydrogenase